MPEQYSTQDLAGRIKAKYPAYANMDDQELVSSVIKKHPKYQTALTTEALQERTAETLPTREETQRAYAAAGPQIKPARKGLVPWLERAYGKMMHEGIPAIGMPALTAGAGGGQKPPGQPSIAEVIAGPALGPVRAATGVARIFTQPTPEYGTAGGARGLSEILGGAMQAAPLPAMAATKGALPAFIPPFEAAMAGTRRAVEPLPISPELKELAATAIPLVGGAAIAGAPAIMRRGRAARAAPVELVGPPPPPPSTPSPVPRLTGGAVRPPAPVRVSPVVERAPQAKPARPVEPLPPPQPIAPREAAELGVAAERVPEVLRRRTEGEAAQKIAAERPAARPSMLARQKGKRTYDEVQKEIDALEEKPGAERQLETLYKEREAIGAGELSESLADIQGRLAKTGIRGEDAKAVLDYYSLRPGKTGGLDQYFAAEYAERFVRKPFIEQVEDIAIKLEIRRTGGEGVDSFRDVSALSKADATKAVRVLREYFGMRPTALPTALPAAERGFLRAEDVLPIEAIRDFAAGMKEIGKGITARFKGKGVRAPSKKVAGDLADQIDVVATKLTRDAEMLLEQTENIAETGTFQPGPPGRGARAERAARAPVKPQLKVSEQMVKDLNAQIVATARAVKELRAQAETTGSASMNRALTAAEAKLEVLAERYRPLPKAAGRAVKAFDYPVPEEVIAEIQRVGLFLKKASKPGISDYIFEAWVNFLLSGPLTHEVNFVSNALVRLSGFAERGGAATVDLLRAKVTGTPRGVFYGEMAQEAFGLWRGIQEGVRNGLEAWRTEAPVTSKLEMARQRAIPGRAGRIIRTPGRALVAADEFAKGINRRVETNALAYRAAAKEGKTGVARAKRIAELVEKPTSKTKEAADVEALYRTFQQPFGPWSRHIASLRSAIPGARYIIPFLRVSINIAKFGLERTPLNFIRVGRMIAKGEVKGAELSAEVAKPLVGTVIGTAVVILAAEGKITGGGPKDRGKRRVLYDTGWQPYSIKIRDTYYSYNRYEPLGALFGMSADLYETFDERSELEQDEIVGRIALSISRNVTSKTYLRGLSDAMNAVSDPDRYASAWVESIAGTAVPTIVAHWARARDPFYRDPTTVLEAVKARLPWISEQVQPRRGVFGQPARRQGGAARRFLLPPIAGPVGGAPERELARLGMGVSVPSKRLGIRGRELELSPEEYGRLQETRGGLARTMIERLVGRAAYQRMSDEQKEQVIRRLMTRAGGAARGRMIRSIPRPQLQQRYAEARR